jgi:N-acetylneuraminic acid mutarotase
LAVLALIFSGYGSQHAHADTWSNAAPLATARDSHTLSLLPNGKVLVAGGMNTAGVALASTELYDPASNTWTAAVTLPAARFAHTATQLPNGKILIAGGSISGYVCLATAVLYDPTLGTWTSTGSMTSARRAFTSTLLANGKVLAVGGYSGSTRLASADLYDPATGIWTATGSMATATSNHTATQLGNGKVLVVGGETRDFVGTTRAELYDPATGQWTPAGALGGPTFYHTATLLPNGKALVVAGLTNSTTALATSYLYDPATNTWAATATGLATARFDHTANLLANGQLVVLGGYNRTSGALTSAEQYDYLTNTWSVLDSLAVARYNHAATILANAKLLVVGGYNHTDSLTAVEVMDPVTASRVPTGNLSASREQHAATLLPNGKVMLAGGFADATHASVDMVDPAGGTCVAGNPMINARKRHTLTQIQGGKVLAAGGNDGSATLASTEIYDVATGTWTNTIATMVGSRELHTATLLRDGKVLVVGGQRAAAALNTAELYNPASGIWTGTTSGVFDPITGIWTSSPSMLATARHSHSATLLPNGKVLIVGGINGASPLASAELYDPDTGIWSATANALATARGAHTATLLPNGKVLVVGGINPEGSALASAELYDPATNTWTVTGELAGARSRHSATLLPGGKVLIAGGDNGSTSLDSTELYDPATATWIPGVSLGSTRKNHTATRLVDGRVLITGGSGDGVYHATAELYDSSSGYQPAWQPQINPPASALMLGASVSLTGSQFRGLSGAANGTTQDSPTNFPVAQLYGVESGCTVALTTTAWTDTSYGSAAFLGVPAGTAILTMSVNGIPAAVLTQVSKSPAAISFSGLSQAWDGTAKSVTATTTPLGLTLTMTYTGTAGTNYPTKTAPPTEVGSYTVAASINDPNFYGSATATLVISNIAGFTTGSVMSGARTNHTATLLNNGKILLAGGQTSGILASSEIYDPATGTSTPTGTMKAARCSHTATLLPNGKVLVAGGTGAGSTPSTAELYDPATGLWSWTGSMSFPRTNHTATLLASGRVLVAGGSSYNVYAEVYNPAGGTWTETGYMTASRMGASATLLADGRVLVVGSLVAAYAQTAELYDPSDGTNGTWARTTTNPLSTRYGHTATLLPNGKVLVAGGNYIIYPATTSVAELYDPVSGTWAAAVGMPSERYFHTATLLPNGRVLITGGRNYYNIIQNNADVYNPETGTWIFIKPVLNIKRYDHTATLLANGKVVIAGGFGGSTTSLSFLGSVELYDYALGSWSAAAAAGTARSGHSATLLPNGSVLAAGGWDGTVTHSSAELFDPINNAWTAGGAMLTARRDHTATLLPNGKILVCGGHDGSTLASAEFFDPITRLWSAAGTLAVSRHLHTATLLADGKVLVTGGKNAAGTPVADSEIYDYLTNQWSLTGALATARYGHTATVLANGKVLVTAGVNGGALASAELYDPAAGTWTPAGSLAIACTGHTTTLLPNGKVLAAGGINGSTYLNNSQLYNPVTNSWTNTTTALVTARAGHAATLLLNGKVLISGGSDGSGALDPAEWFDPATGSWSATGYSSTKRAFHSATVLLDGRICVIGGSNSSGVLNHADIYHVDLNFKTTSQPLVTEMPNLCLPGASVALKGTRFSGISEGSGGNGSQNSASNLPVVKLRTLDGGLTAVLQPVSWSEGTFTSTAIDNFPKGYAMLTLYANGIPSQSRIIDFVPPPVVLTSLATSAGTLTPAFSSAVLSYEVVLPDETSTISITASSSDASQVSIDGMMVASGQASPPINLAVGLNEISVLLFDGCYGTTPYNISVTANYVPPRPANDDFANAITLPAAGGTVSGSNDNATRETDEPFHANIPGGKSVWWRWTAPAGGRIAVDTAGSSFDTLLAAYTGTAVDNLTLIASNNNSGGSQSRIEFNVTAGTTYQFAVDGFLGDSGTITLNMTVSDFDMLYADWAAAENLTGDNALPEAIPHGDGIKNLIKYAFNMDGSGPDVRVLVPGSGTTPGTGTAGLPSLTLDRSAAQATLRFEFLRRKNSGLTYTPLKSVDLTNWLPLGAVPAISDVDTEWERVLVAEPCDPAVTPLGFGRVLVELP